MVWGVGLGIGVVVLPAICGLLRGWCNIGFTSFARLGCWICVMVILGWWVCLQWFSF